MIYKNTQEYIFNFDSEEDTMYYYDAICKLNSLNVPYRTLNFGGYAFVITEHYRTITKKEDIIL